MPKSGCLEVLLRRQDLFSQVFLLVRCKIGYIADGPVMNAADLQMLSLLNPSGGKQELLDYGMRMIRSTRHWTRLVLLRHAHNSCVVSRVVEVNCLTMLSC